MRTIKVNPGNLLRRLCFPVVLLFGINFCNAQIYISCVGDSITYGAGVSNPSVDGYPARLQKLLGTNYVVRNWGVSGTTLLKQGDSPYWNTSYYQLSHVIYGTVAPNIVIIMLGSNDSKPQNWVYGTNYVPNYLGLIASYVTNKYLPNPRILICTPPPIGVTSVDPFQTAVTEDATCFGGWSVSTAYFASLAKTVGVHFVRP